jgi:hypothetical protein
MISAFEEPMRIVLGKKTTTVMSQRDFTAFRR